MESFSAAVMCVVFLFISGNNAAKVTGHDVKVVAGHNALLSCEMDKISEELTSVTWERRTKDNPKTTEFFVIASNGKVDYTNGLKERVRFTGNFTRLNGSILLSNVTLSDEGTYTCVFSIFPSGPQEASLQLRVLLPPDVDVGVDVPPVSGDTEEILATCIAANAKPAAEVLWTLGPMNNSLKVQTNTTVDSEGRYTIKSSLIGVPSKDLNQQKVQCLVTHPGLKQKLEKDYTLIIYYSPQVAYILGDRSRFMEFQCEADANPKPTNFTWSRDFPVKKPLSSGVNGRFIIPDGEEHNGLYYCVVSNHYGTSVASLYVHVISEPKTCWILLIIFIIAAICGFLFLKYRQHECLKGFWPSRDNPVPTDSPELDRMSHGSNPSCGAIP